MAHLEEILVHGVATQVWNMDSTAQQIDDTVAKGEYATNPNLLINPGFVDQRGSSPYVGAKYGPDCILGLANVTKSLDNGVLTLSAKGTTSVTTHFLTGITDYSQVSGKQYTASVVDTSWNLYTVSGVVPSSVTPTIVTKNTPFGAIGIFFVENKGLSVGIAAQKAALSIPRYGIKLEQGPTQTLARKLENGTAELLEREDPLELLKCQRYLKVIAQNGKDVGPFSGIITSGAKELWISIPTNIPMRISPTVALSGGVLIRTVTGYAPSGDPTPLTPTSATAAMDKIGYVLNLRFVFSESLGTNNTPATLSLNSGEVLLSAEL